VIEILQFFIKDLLIKFAAQSLKKSIMRKSLLTILLALCILTLASAQDYNTGIGLRAGFSQGLTIKHFVSEKAAFEGLLSTRWQGFDITGLYEIHNQAFDVSRLNWYYGFGGHIGFWNGNNTNWGTRNTTYTVVGIDGILGMEYNFSEAPINIGLDWKPAFNIIGYTGFWGDGGALSIRYIF
jgi:opacity protein-like surface antigen